MNVKELHAALSEALAAGHGDRPIVFDCIQKDARRFPEYILFVVGHGAEVNAWRAVTDAERRKGEVEGALERQEALVRDISGAHNRLYADYASLRKGHANLRDAFDRDSAALMELRAWKVNALDQFDVLAAESKRAAEALSAALALNASLQARCDTAEAAVRDAPLAPATNTPKSPPSPKSLDVPALLLIIDALRLQVDKLQAAIKPVHAATCSLRFPGMYPNQCTCGLTPPTTPPTHPTGC